MATSPTTALRTTSDWRPIPGYDGAYEINRMGEIRSWRHGGEKRRASVSHMLVPYMAHKGRLTRRRYVKLTSPDGKAREVAVINLMVDIWLGGRPKGMVAYHKNGDLNDNCLHNIGFCTRQELGRRTGRQATRMVVEKVTPQGEVVAIYSSARAAAKANYASYQVILDRCHGKVKRPYAMDGHDYRFAKD